MHIEDKKGEAKAFSSCSSSEAFIQRRIVVMKNRFANIKIVPVTR